MDGAASTKGDQSKSAGVSSPLAGDGPERPPHIRIDEQVDAMSSVGFGQAEGLADLVGQCGPGCVSIDRKIAAQEEVPSKSV